MNEITKNKKITTTDKIAFQRFESSYNGKITIDSDINQKLLNADVENFNLSSRWGGKTDTIDNYMRKLKCFPKLSAMTNEYDENRDSIIYTLINTLLFSQGSYSNNITAVNLLKAIRQSILYITIDEIDQSTDSDFIFNDGKLIPLSYLMEQIRDYDNFAPIMTVNSNGLKPYDQAIIDEKLATDKTNGYYTGAIDIGRENGKLMWKSIRLKELKLKFQIN